MVAVPYRLAYCTQVRMGFPQRSTDDASSAVFAGEDAKLMAGSYTCPRQAGVLRIMVAGTIHPRLAYHSQRGVLLPMLTGSAVHATPANLTHSLRGPLHIAVHGWP